MALGVLRNEGVLGFWRGNGLNVLRTAPYKVGAAAQAAPPCAPCKLNACYSASPDEDSATLLSRHQWACSGATFPLCAPQAVNFSSYDAYRKLMQLRNGGEHLGRLGSFGAGALAGGTRTLLDITPANLPDARPSPELPLRPAHRVKPHLQQGALSRAATGVTAMLTCFPLDVVRTRIMSAPIGSSPAPLTLMRSIARTEVRTSVLHSRLTVLRNFSSVRRRRRRRRSCMVKVAWVVGGLISSNTAVCGAGVQGFGALYAGVLPALISVAPSGAVFYGTYDLLKVPSGLHLLFLAVGSCETSLVVSCMACSHWRRTCSHHITGVGVVRVVSFLRLRSDACMPMLCCRSGTWPM